MSDAGDDQVLITRAEYEELLAYRAAAAARARPAEVEAMIADGATPLRAWRKHRGLTQAQLAAAGGIAQGHLSELEAGAKTPTKYTLHFLARALGVPAAAL